MKEVCLVAAATVLAVPACDTSQYAFRIDESISFVQPEARATVDLPVTISWADENPPPASLVDRSDPDAAYYAVFVDRSPIGPGAALSSLADDPEQCAEDPECPDVLVLADRGVLVSAEPEVELEFLADRRSGGRGKDQHEVTIVRMRGDRRQGEAAWDQTFYVNR